MKNKKSKRVLVSAAVSVCILIFIFYILAAGNAQAAELFFKAESQTFAQGDVFPVGVFLNTQGESVNAAEGKIFFPPQLLEVKEVRDGNSIINFWVERPKEERAGTVSFSGITPGGYQAAKGILFSIVFRAKSSGSGTIGIRDAKVLLNNGDGTLASLNIAPFPFSISESGPAVQSAAEPVKDSEPPEAFTPEIVQSPDVFGGKWFLVFAAQDKGSGIAGYAVRESQLRTLAIFSKWQSAASPYVLSDQELKSYISVKAIDTAGNTRIMALAPRYPLPWYEQPLIWVIIGGVITLYVIGKRIWKKSIPSRQPR